MPRLKYFIILLIGSFLSAAIAFAQNNSSEIKDGLKQKLTPMQYFVTQEKGTEPAYQNAYWNNKEPGIYVDVVTGAPLFSSTDKYDSKTGWPSFTKPIDQKNVTYKPDPGLIFNRTEVLSKDGSHLRHVFEDGPPPTHKRYCINSAALKFIPANELKEKGYGQYESLFEKNEPQVNLKE